MNRLSILCLSAFIFASNQLGAQVLTEWVENRALGETNKIALGYPVLMTIC